MTPTVSDPSVDYQNIRDLTEASNQLSRLPLSTEDLLKALTEMEKILSRVEQSPSESMKYTLQSITEVIFVKELVKHPDIDVNIRVTCCICEILRITTPNVPYNTEKMTEFFELAVNIFEKLVNVSDGCYDKMSRVLELFGGNRLAVLMVTMQLDGLVGRLFKQFLTAADSNSSAIVHKMESIMTMIIEESGMINPELVDLLVKSVRKDNQIDSPVCRQLGERIIKNCAAKLKPHLPNMEAKETITCTNERSELRNDTAHNTIRYSQHEIKDTALSDDLPKCVTKVKGKRKTNNSLWKTQTQSIEHGENLVGSRIKVWCSLRKVYEKGVVKSFDSGSKKHKVLYDDGDEGLADLRVERWKLFENVTTLHDAEAKETITSKCVPKVNGKRKRNNSSWKKQVSPAKVSSPQSDTVCIQGYKVKSGIAPLLKAIFKKHGDIASECVFKATSVKAYFLEIICEVVRRIQTGDFKNVVIEMEELERQVSDAEASNINVSWLRPHLEACMLMETKTNITLVKKAAQMDRNERYAKLMTAQKRFEKAESRLKVLSLVEKNLNNVVESKVKKDSWVKQSII